MGVDTSQVNLLLKRLDWAFSEKMGDTFYHVFSAKIMEIHGALREGSPVDVGTFREHWSFNIRKNYQGALLWGSIYNDVPYAAPLVYGSEKGEKPWPSPGPKTLEVSGRIYSTQSPHNLIDSVMDEINFNEIQDLYMDTLNSLI